MKGRAKTYILLVAVLAIWSIRGFKIVATLNPDAPEVSKQEDMVLFTPKNDMVSDTFSIQPSERDPFLGTLYVKRQTKTNQKISKPKEVFVWIPIVYHGTVSKQGNKEQICVLSINGQQQIMKVGQEVNEVKLLKANNSEAVVSYKGQKKTVAKL